MTGKCNFCEVTHPHPRSSAALDAGWMVAEMRINGKKFTVISCPNHTHLFNEELFRLARQGMPKFF